MAMRRLGMTALLGLALASGARGQGVPRLLDAAWMGFNTGSFDLASSHGFGPTAFAAGDLDGDGDADLLVGHGYFGAPGLSILLAHGDGTYAPPLYTPLPMNDSVGRVALSDVDGDGDLDALATIPDAWNTGSQVALWRNDGRAGLSAPERMACGLAPLGLVLADLDGDGHEDLITADSQAETISILRHDGMAGAAAGFLAASPTSVGMGPIDVAAGDLDGDGFMDLAVARADPFTPVVRLLYNDGSGGFRFPIDVPAGVFGGPVIALGDMDNDGDLDIVVGRQTNDAGQGVIRVLPNDGSGGFRSYTETRLDNACPYPADLDLADFDGNGFLDVVVAAPSTRNGDGFRVVLSDGRGGFLPTLARPATQSSEAVIAVDVDADGDDDVLTLGRYSSAVTVALNPGDGVFPAPVPHAVNGPGRDIDAADIDGDGDLDVATAAALVQVHVNVGGRRFAPAATIPLPVSFAPAWHVKLRDLDDDGNVDLLLGPASGAGFGVARGRGDGTFDPMVQWPFPCGGPVEAFDLDGDGDLDVVMPACSSGFDAYILVTRNDGASTFSMMPSLPMQVTGNRIESADVDGDGVPDLVTNESGYGLATFHGNGDLTFGPERLSSVTPPLHFALGDFNGDSRTDAGVVIGQGSFGTDMAGIALGLGDGTFAEPLALEAGSSTLESLLLTDDLDADDLDCDGLPDLVTTCYASNDIGVFSSLGDGTLAPHARYGAGLQGGASVIRDIDRDGLNDVATIAQSLSDPSVPNALFLLPGACGCLSTIPGHVRLRVSDTQLAWTAPAGTVGCDIVSGDLDLLHASRGDFSTATSSCLVNDTIARAASWTDVPGSNLWFLVSAIDCAAAGSWDSLDPVQLRSRDAGIASSAARCP